ncbi:hypothetical protein [Streptomyces caniscabiei]|uniref:hypothetical protein n=1 Tax=Streptomyces caniscabiei TaxID=2746961 RepID=UPI000765D463|nr:hypothetical protein [Streptomyces caniscabiei]
MKPARSAPPGACRCRTAAGSAKGFPTRTAARTHAQMRHAITTRHTIGEAMGTLMGATADPAPSDHYAMVADLEAA